MTHYTELLIRALKQNWPNKQAARNGVFERARSTLGEELRRVSPPLTAARFDQEMLKLEQSIVEAEREFPALPDHVRRMRINVNPESKPKPPDPLGPASLLHQYRVSNPDAAAVPGLALKALIIPGGKDSEGVLVQSVGRAWYEILDRFRSNPAEMYGLDPRMWEEIVAGAYERDGFKVVITPRSGDKGRDVIASKDGFGAVKFFDQVKAYKPDHLVTAEEVRALMGVVSMDGNVSKGVLSTTSGFAPRLLEDEYIRRHVPFRIELRGRDDLLPWLLRLSENQD